MKTPACLVTFALAFAPQLAAPAAADEAAGVEVELKAPMLVCHALSGGVRPPHDAGTSAEHDLIFFVLAGSGPGGAPVAQVAPKDGSHLKLDTRRATMIVKDVTLWKGRLARGESATVLLSVREQDGKDTADQDVDEAKQVARGVDNTKPLAEIARTQVSAVLKAGAGENDHIGTVALRLTNRDGRVTLETAPGESSTYLKGFAANHPTDRSFQLTGDRSDYRLHLRVATHD
jgi:hypothetical protein